MLQGRDSVQQTASAGVPGDFADPQTVELPLENPDGHDPSFTPNSAFLEFGKQNWGLFLLPSQASTGRQPQGTGPSLQDQGCDASAFGALLCIAFSLLPHPL